MRRNPKLKNGRCVTINAGAKLLCIPQISCNCPYCACAIPGWREEEGVELAGQKGEVSVLEDVYCLVDVLPSFLGLPGPPCLRRAPTRTKSRPPRERGGADREPTFVHPVPDAKKNASYLAYPSIHHAQQLPKAFFDVGK